MTYIFACEGNDEVFQFVQAVVDTCAPSFLHQWFHSLEEHKENLGFILDSQPGVQIRFKENNFNTTKPLLTFLNSRASFLLATVRLGEKDRSDSKPTLGDIFTIFFVSDLLKAEK